MTAELLIRRQTVTAQILSIFQEKIASGAWTARLPPERELSRQFGVSRNTCRAALDILAQKGWIERRHGSGTRVRSRHERRAHALRKPASVGLIFPGGVNRQRLVHLFWINELQSRLFEEGIRFDLFHSSSCYGPRPGRALEQLVHQSPQACWVLCFSSRAMQEWFSRHRLPCVVAGSRHEGSELPMVDIDFRAAMRHAISTLFRLGHRNVALLRRRYPMGGGDVDTEQGFLEAMRGCRDPAARAILADHDETPEGIEASVRRLMSGLRSPTALIVIDTHAYLAVTGTLARMNLRVPEDVSLISRDDDVCLSFCVPQPARYRVDPILHARKLLRKIRTALQEYRLPSQAIRIIPTFVAGNSLAPPGKVVP